MRTRKRLTQRQKTALLGRYEADMQRGRNREEILWELAEEIGVTSQRQVERILAQAKEYQSEIERHQQKLSITASLLALNLGRCWDNFDLCTDTLGVVVYGGLAHEVGGPSAIMETVDRSVALNLLYHLKDEFPELTDIKDWAELNNDKITKDFVERLRLRAYRGDFGKCPACPNC